MTMLSCIPHALPPNTTSDGTEELQSGTDSGKQIIIIIINVVNTREAMICVNTTPIFYLLSGLGYIPNQYIAVQIQCSSS